MSAFERTLQVNSALHPSGVAKSSTSFGWGKGGNVTSAGWQVTLSDPMWHVSSRSGVAILRTAIHLLLTYLLTYVKIAYRIVWCVSVAYSGEGWRGLNPHDFQKILQHITYHKFNHSCHWQISRLNHSISTKIIHTIHTNLYSAKNRENESESLRKRKLKNSSGRGARHPPQTSLSVWMGTPLPISHPSTSRSRRLRHLDSKSPPLKISGYATDKFYWLHKCASYFALSIPQIPLTMHFSAISQTSLEAKLEHSVKRVRAHNNL